MKKIRTIIVDDEPLPLKRLQDLLQEDDEIDLIGKYANGKDAIVNIREKQPDLVFLDIQMPEVDGFEVLDHIDQIATPIIIFVTAYDRYALKAFDVHAMDYLLKPFDKKRFIEALKRAKKYVQNATETTLKSSIEQLLNHHRSNHGFLSKVMVKTNSRVFFLNVDIIDWVEASGNYVRIHSGEKSYLIRGTMNSMERKLDPSYFIRIHRSYIVNVNSIKELEAWFHGDYKVVLKSGKELILSRNYKRLLQQFN